LWVRAVGLRRCTQLTNCSISDSMKKPPVEKNVLDWHPSFYSQEDFDS
jgi:hypothetical protein